MGLREDVKFMVKQEPQYEPKVPNENIILKQAIQTIKSGKSKGNVALDRKAIQEINAEEER